MAEMIDLIQGLYNSLQEKFGTGGDTLGPGSIFLAFERLGIGLSANDFKLQPTDSTFNPAIVAQHGARLVDFVAQLDSDGFVMARGDLSPTVTGQYDQILSGASYGIQPASDDALTSFLAAKGVARRTFDESQAAVDVAQNYWPATLAPGDWFDDQDATIWSGYSSSTGESSQPSDSAPPPPPTPPRLIQTSWSWRVVTPEAAPNLDAVRKLQATPALQRYSTDITPISAVPASPAVIRMAARPTLTATSTMRLAATAAPTARPIAHLAINRVATLPPAADVVESELSRPQPIRKPVSTITSMRLNPILATSAALSSVVSSLPAQPTSSTNFQLSFQYCVVDVSRPWLSGDFLGAADWYVPGLAAGALAQGAYSKGAQKFAFLPTKMLVVKNLAITAQWSQQDRTFAQSSASFGPFSLLNTRFENDTLTAPGMQIIAWFCQVVPMVPALADPALTTVTAS